MRTRYVKAHLSNGGERQTSVQLDRVATTLSQPVE